MNSHILRAIKNNRFTYINIKKYISFLILHFIDYYYDKKIVGLDLTKTDPSPIQDEKKQIGMTPSQPAHYWILEKIFDHVFFSQEDCFFDVGCGKGRVFSFLLREKCPCQIYGVELSEVPGKVALEWTKRYDQIHVTLGDAFEMDYSPYTIIFLNRPFLTQTFLQFIALLESQVKKKITVIYLFDQLNGFHLNNRPGWILNYRERFFKIHGLEVASSPQYFSIWEYEPEEKSPILGSDRAPCKGASHSRLEMPTR